MGCNATAAEAMAEETEERTDYENSCRDSNSSNSRARAAEAGAAATDAAAGATSATGQQQQHYRGKWQNLFHFHRRFVSSSICSGHRLFHLQSILTSSPSCSSSSSFSSTFLLFSLHIFVCRHSIHSLDGMLPQN